VLGRFDALCWCTREVQPPVRDRHFAVAVREAVAWSIGSARRVRRAARRPGVQPRLE